jgi:hypothetical protein
VFFEETQLKPIPYQVLRRDDGEIALSVNFLDLCLDPGLHGLPGLPSALRDQMRDLASSVALPVPPGDPQVLTYHLAPPEVAIGPKAREQSATKAMRWDACIDQCFVLRNLPLDVVAFLDRESEITFLEFSNLGLIRAGVLSASRTGGETAHAHARQRAQ